MATFQRFTALEMFPLVRDVNVCRYEACTNTLTHPAHPRNDARDDGIPLAGQCTHMQLQVSSWNVCWECACLSIALT